MTRTRSNSISLAHVFTQPDCSVCGDNWSVWTPHLPSLETRGDSWLSGLVSPQSRYREEWKYTINHPYCFLVLLKKEGSLISTIHGFISLKSNGQSICKQELNHDFIQILKMPLGIANLFHLPTAVYFKWLLSNNESVFQTDRDFIYTMYYNPVSHRNQYLYFNEQVITLEIALTS